MTVLAPTKNHRNGGVPKAAVHRPVLTEPDPPVAFSGFELKATTASGARLVTLAEKLAAQFAERAAEHDREATYPFEAIEALKESGYFVAPIPEEFGGLGVESVHDLLVASSRLARGEPSVIIGVNMHLLSIINIRRRYNMAVATGNEKRIGVFGGLMRMMSQSGVILAAAVSEPNQNLSRPDTRAVRTPTGWVINGKKIFCTMSPAADALFVAVTFENDEGEELYGYAMVPKNTEGVTVHDDWDALGMRASGSHSVSLTDVRVPETALRNGFPAGDVSQFLGRSLEAGVFHASASLGIAESAHAASLKSLVTKRSGSDERPRNLMLASENAIDIAAMRAVIDRAGHIADQYYADHPTEEGTDQEIIETFAELQSAKTFINEVSVQVVDRALSMSGGAGYFNKHPLSRAYRDVRAGAFMHPLGTNRAYEFIGQVALGLPLEIT
jgi:alkylation response protein AidB-like acyl-CoA dehydrogenase